MNIPNWMRTAPRFNTVWNGKVDPQPELTRHPAHNIPVERIEEDSMYPEDLLTNLGMTPRPVNIYVLRSDDNRHAVIRRKHNERQINCLVAYTQLRRARAACEKSQSFKPTLVDFDEAASIAHDIKGIDVHAIILLDDINEPVFHYVR